MTTLTTIGLDLAEMVFQVHGVDAARKVVVARKLRCKGIRQAAAVSGRHGRLRQCALLGA